MSGLRASRDAIRADVALTCRLAFEGDYTAEELADLAERWVRAGLDDRTDLRGVTVSGAVVSETALDETEDNA